MQRLKRAVYAYNEKMKVLEKLCTSENQMLSEVLTSKELNRISSSLPAWEENKQYATGSTAVYEGDVYKFTWRVDDPGGYTTLEVSFEPTQGAFDDMVATTKAYMETAFGNFD